MSNGSPMRRASLPAFPNPTRPRAPLLARTMRPMDGTAELKHSPLEKEHAALGAKLGPFGGWLMPIEYQGALAEHRAVRERSEEHTSELQSHSDLVCRLLLEKKKKN